MRRFLFLWLALVTLLAACGQQATAPEPTTAVMEGNGLQMLIATNDFQVGRPRVPFVLYDGPDRVGEVGEVAVDLYDLSGDDPQLTWSGTAESYSDYEIPYWVVYPEIPSAGNWGLALNITDAQGNETQANAAIAVAEASSAPAVGERPPASENRTLETEPDINKLTSDDDPVAALYQMTVAEALDSDMPAVVTFSTPRFRTSELCGPVLDAIEEVHADSGEQANFIHLEIYKDFDTLAVADEVDEWGLISEPWTFVLDRDGRIAAKFGGPLSPRELSASLDAVLE